jgi:hypothetical protein
LAKYLTLCQTQNYCTINIPRPVEIKIMTQLIFDTYKTRNYSTTNIWPLSNSELWHNIRHRAKLIIVAHLIFQAHLNTNCGTTDIWQNVKLQISAQLVFDTLSAENYGTIFDSLSN